MKLIFDAEPCEKAKGSCYTGTSCVGCVGGNQRIIIDTKLQVQPIATAVTNGNILFDVNNLYNLCWYAPNTQDTFTDFDEWDDDDWDDAS